MRLGPCSVGDVLASAAQALLRVWTTQARHPVLHCAWQPHIGPLQSATGSRMWSFIQSLIDLAATRLTGSERARERLANMLAKLGVKGADRTRISPGTSLFRSSLLCWRVEQASGAMQLCIHLERSSR